MIRREWLSSTLVMLGLGRIFPSLLRIHQSRIEPAPDTQQYKITWDFDDTENPVEDNDLEIAVQRYVGGKWVDAARTNIHEREIMFRALPHDDIRMQFPLTTLRNPNVRFWWYLEPPGLHGQIGEVWT